ncbi:hypothetical protein [Blastococcus sp. TF02A-26]|uniref:hypothetical protein n=1 Tax=Blastococcus sp. TF02A-26 TaxID=2250577 RepID=UPI000DEBCD1A|nr:hypothetical protein [Blastococcus sp. TF02A-26]RBY82684.1 hypothetical protein DQ240_18495 [Blastococcus sp. TF02A-26]
MNGLTKDVVIKLLGDSSDAQRAIRAAAAEAEVSVSAYKKAQREYDKQQKAMADAAAKHRLAVEVAAAKSRDEVASIARGLALVVGAATAAGVALPVALAGVAMGFGVIGIAAASQNDEVKAAFAGLVDTVKDGVDEIGQPMADVLPGIADRMGASFQRMKPQIIDAVEAAAPQMERLTDSTLDMAENALPGLVAAVENAGPAVDGLGSFMERTGTAVGDFFADLSEKSPAAQQAFDGLGDVVVELLPVLATLIGEGAELAGDVLPAVAATLPAVNSGLSLVLNTAQALGPALPAIIAGFVGMKAAGFAGSLIGGLGNNMQALEGRLGTSNTALGRTGGALTNVGKALPIIGIGVAAVSAGMASAEQNVREFGESAALLFAKVRAGGPDAEAAQQSLERLRQAAADIGGDFQKAYEEAKEFNDSLTPLQVAQQNVTVAETELANAIRDHGRESAEATGAQERYEQAQRDVADAAGETELALYGVTQAMIDQANQALAAIDSQFGYQNSLNQLEDAQAAVAEAQAHLNDANEDIRTSTEDVERAQLAAAEAAKNTAVAFGQQQADMSGAAQGSEEYARILQTSALQELYRLRDAAGPELAGAIDQQIAMLEASGVSLQETGVHAAAAKDRMEELGAKVTEIPGYKGVVIDAPTDQQRQQIEALGYKIVTLPNGQVYVTADTRDAETALANLSRIRYATIVATTAGGSSTRGADVNALRQNAERAVGGPVWPNQTFLVGEKGPELVRFGAQGYVTPADLTAQALRQPAAAAAAAAAPVLTPAPAAAPAAMGGVVRLDIDYNRLGAVVAAIADRRPTVGQVVTQRDETGFEMADKLTWTAATRGLDG